jgi:hypothetical protein
MSHARLLLLVLLLGGAAAGLWFALPESGDAPKLYGELAPPTPAADSLLRLDPRELARLTIHQPRFNETLRVERGADGVWRLTEPQQDWAEPVVLMSALQALYDRDWSEAPAAWEQQSDADLGLEPAAVAIEAREASGTTQLLRIGAQEPSGRWRAATLDGRRIRVGESLISRLARDAQEWRDHRLQPLPPPAVQHIRWEPRAGEALELTRSANGWRVVAPYSAQMDERQTAFVERLLGARAVMVERDPLDQRPPAGDLVGTLVCSGSGGSTTLKLHGEGVIASHRNYVMSWSPDDFVLLFRPPEQFRSPRVLDLDAAAIVSLRVEYGAAAAVFRRVATGWTLEGGGNLDAEASGFVEGLLKEGVRAEGAEWDAKPEGAPAGRVTFSISRTPRPQPGHVLEWWTDATGRVTVAAADADRATRTDVNFELAVRELMRRIGAQPAGG